MRKLRAVAAVMILGVAPALAQADGPDQECRHDPETTGSLSLDPRSLYLPGERSDRAGETLPEESWQEEARENAERRRQHLLACGVD